MWESFPVFSFQLAVLIAGKESEIEGAGGSGSFFVGEMEIDHSGGDVGVAENVLESSDVGVGVEEVRGEAVSEGVAGDAFGDGGFLEGVFELSLHGVLEEMVAGKFPGFRMGAQPGGREEEAPRKFEGSLGVFTLK